jgi:hypothetical protein
MGGGAIKVNHVSSHCGFSLLFLFGLEWVPSVRPSVRPVTIDDRPYARHMTFLILRHDLQIWSREEDEYETALCFLLAQFRQKEKLKNQKFENEVFFEGFQSPEVRQRIK